MGVDILSGDEFFRWDMKTSGIKNSEYESQTKFDSDCSF